MAAGVGRSLLILLSIPFILLHTLAVFFIIFYFIIYPCGGVQLEVGFIHVHKVVSCSAHNFVFTKKSFASLFLKLNVKGVTRF